MKSQMQVSATQFDRLLYRRNHRSWKWMNYDEDVIPLWVADMDFDTSPAIRLALCNRAAEAWYPYEFYRQELFDAFADWLEIRCHWKPKRTDIRLLPGTMVGVKFILQTLVGKGGVIVCPPLYPPLREAGQIVGMSVQEVPWKVAGQEWVLDIEGIDQAARVNKVLLLCHPHNPLGRVLTREQMQELAHVVLSRDLTVISNELWGDLTLDMNHHPFVTIEPALSDRTVTIMGPSKTFNLSGIGISLVVCEKGVLQRRLWDHLDNWLPEVNVFALAAAEAAWTDKSNWLPELKAYLTANRSLITSTLLSDMPTVSWIPPQAGYLGWLDFSHTSIADRPGAAILQHGRVAVSDGAEFGGKGFVRLNFACPRSRLAAALDRIASCIGGDR